MSSVEAITAAIAELPAEQVAQIRAWLYEREAAEWDTQIEQDERSGRLAVVAQRALDEHRTGQTKSL